jgi:hypothetical protein
VKQPSCRTVLGQSPWAGLETGTQPMSAARHGDHDWDDETARTSASWGISFAPDSFILRPGRVTKAQCGVWPTSIGRCGPWCVPDAGPRGAWHLCALRVLFGSQREQFSAILGVRCNREIDHSLQNPCSRHICGNRLFYPTGTVTVDLGCLLCRGAGVWLE